ncbi:MAG: HAMP domain-containing histidine kinase [Flavobacteriales bacterium]|nr:HAMP domain-containing histidine kinase [Flavobacteriales bacterium]MCB9166644.1 HAMP domain-containing histidine kinase [Flavobacteriales bacterium]
MREAPHRVPWGSGLFWKVSAIFLVVLLVFAGITLKVHIDTSRNYALEVAQRLNHDLAAHTVNEIRPFLNGEVAEEKIGTLMHSMMAVNPSIEVYVLDTAGKILKYVALDGEVKLDSVGMDPIRRFVAGPREQVPIVGDDPRAPGEQKIFSAAAVEENGRIEGYVYIILASQEYAGAADTLFGSYFLQLGSRSILFAFLLTVVGGLLAIYFITMDLDRIIAGFRRFQSGDLGTRIHPPGRGALGHVATTFNDMAGTIERNIEELKGMDKLRKELIGNVSHDLRTPIAAIQGYAETLLMKEDRLSADERRDHLRTIMQSAERLRRLVDDLFTLSKLEAGQTELELEPLSLGELVHDVVNKLRLLAKEKNVSINIIMAKDLPIVEVDVRQIDRVLQNLLHNAIKFCRPGDHITVELDGTRPDAVEVRISDTGIGIPEDELPHIFDRYFSGGRSLKGDGAGLGLAIVKRILQMHGSDVEVSSKPDAGSTFSFTLRSRIA